MASLLTMQMSFSWIIRPSHDLEGVHDEFVVGQFRVRLLGNSLKIEMEESGGKNAEVEARQLADRYIESLRANLHRGLFLITAEEFRSIPVTATIITAPFRRLREPVDFSRAIQKARRALVRDAVLSRCYDYLDEARESEGEKALYPLWKLVETVQGTGVVEALDVGTEIEIIRTLANPPRRDARHAPKPGEAVQPPTAEEVRHAKECGTRILRTYERYCMERKAG